MTVAVAVASVVLLVAVAGHRLRPAPRRARPADGTGAGRVAHLDRSAPFVGFSARLDERVARHLPALLAGVAVLAVAGPAPGLVAGTVAAVSGPVMARRREQGRRRAVEAAVPDLVDLFVVAASAGLPVASSLAVVAPRAPSATAPLVGAAARRFDRGSPLGECLTDLGADLGPTGRPLTEALGQAAGSGVPLVPLLEAVAATARDQRRRRAQEVARRLPVTMLFPLVACIFPAAVLLAVVPVLLVSLASLSP